MGEFELFVRTDTILAFILFSGSILRHKPSKFVTYKVESIFMAVPGRWDLGSQLTTSFELYEGTRGTVSAIISSVPPSKTTCRSPATK